MVRSSRGQHRLESLMILVTGLFDERGHSGNSLCGNARNGEIVPLHVFEYLQGFGIVRLTNAHSINDHTIGNPLINQLQVFVVAFAPLGEVHIRNGIIDGEQFTAFGIVMQNNCNDATLTPLNCGQALGLEHNQDFRKAHIVTTFLLV